MDGKAFGFPLKKKRKSEKITISLSGASLFGERFFFFFKTFGLFHFSLLRFPSSPLALYSSKVRLTRCRRRL